MNVYDFDHTIYDGDSSLDFVCFCVKRHWLLCFLLPFQFAVGIGIKLKIISTKRGKELFLFFLRFYPAEPTAIAAFWQIHKQKITSWYLECQQPDDLIISASPEFLLKFLVEGELNKKVIATKVDPYSGKIYGNNCKGQEKVLMFQKYNSNRNIENFYSDSLSDAPLAKLADHAFLISHLGGHVRIRPWPSR